MSTDSINAQAFLRAEGLGFPELPHELSAQLSERSPGVYSSCELVVSPYDMEAHVAKLLRSDRPKDYAVLAIDTQGVNNGAFHYFLVSGPLALFVQLPWAGALKDAAPSRKEIDRVLDWAAPLLDRLSELQERGRLESDRRLVAVITHLSEARWAWTYQAGSNSDEITWRPAKKLLAAIDAELKAMAK
ncbi:hypothetical protein [Ottowia thiooxydans]|uniref:hypothetical protein n=1 Tax=Ottowia thiooxydans TaxID=219182 RepID=UPI00041A983B|nr:hypothetical protein [Ottowia thiooxydans]